VVKTGPDTDSRRIGLAAAAGFGAFAVASALFDLLSFWQVPYLFLFIAGLCAVAAPRPEVVRAPALAPVPAT
jgi:hypothetical protein